MMHGPINIRFTVLYVFIFRFSVRTLDGKTYRITANIPGIYT